MNFTEGVAKMKSLAEELKRNKVQTGYLKAGSLVISYPGYKKSGDYRLSENGVAPKHTDIVSEIYNSTCEENFDAIVNFLEDVYTNGLYAKATIFPPSFKEKIFWITLQEEINYPPPQYAGRKLSFQRFYEGALAKTGVTDLPAVLARTNNHGKERPVLFKVEQYKTPAFYK